MNRRKFVRNAGLGIGALLAAGAAYRFTRVQSGPYDPYFEALNQTLKQHKRAIPFLILDLDLLDRNIAELKKIIPPERFRIVVKSLPSPELIAYMMQNIGTKRLMSFHQPFLSRLSASADAQTNILLGKPMPVSTAAYYYDTFQAGNGFDPARQLQWLVDTEARIEEYIALADAKNLRLSLNVEIDVGLHRGGFDSLETLEKGLARIAARPDRVTFSGFMGYDAHIVKVPELLLSREDAYAHMRDFYNACKDLARTKFQALWRDDLTFNGAGSPTLALHRRSDSPLNDVSAGSFAVKPTDFDIDTLAAFQAAAFIAAPVLKKRAGTVLPSVEAFSGLFSLLDPNQQNAYYIYGGSWMAEPHQPPGIRYNSLFGKSTNQVMLNASSNTRLDVGDYVFFRPHQSEFVFLQFGGILALRNGKIEGEWSVLS